MSNISLSTALKVSALICSNPVLASQDQLVELQQNNLVFETCKLEEIEATAFYDLESAKGMMLESITSKRNRLERTIRAFDKSLKKAFVGTGIDTTDFKIGNARNAGTFAVLAAKINLTDGQSISIIFHAPDDDPTKIGKEDTLIAFRFMLNRSDVTHVVAPSGGTDVSLKQVTVALSNLAERNSDKFIKKQADNKAQKEELEAIQLDTEQIEQQQEALSSEIDSLEAQVDSKKTLINGKKSISNKLTEQNKKLEAQLAELKAKVVTIEPKSEDYVSDKIKDLVRNMSLADFQVHAKENLGINSQTAEDLYNDTKTILEREFEQQQEAKTKLLIQDEPQNRFMNRVYEKLKESQGENVKFSADDKYPRISVATAINSIELTSGTLKEGERAVTLSLDVNDIEVSEYTPVNVVFDESMNADEETVNKAAEQVLELVKKYTSSVVDTSNLPKYGSKSGENKGTKEIAAETRSLITKMKKEGKLPKGLKVSITRDYNSINATIKDVDQSVNVFSQAYLEYQSKVNSGEIDEHDYNQRFRGEYLSVHMMSIKKVIDAHVNSHHWDKSDVMTDYFHSAFYYTGGASVGYGLRDARLADELAVYEATKAGVVKQEPDSNDITGDKYSNDLKGKDLAKAIRTDINAAIKDVGSVLSGARITVKSAKSTHKDKVVVTIREITGEKSYNDVLSGVNKIANAYNRKTGSGIDDSTDLHFILEVINEVPEKDAPPADTEQEAEFWYGLRARPIMIGTVPKNYLEALDNQQAAAKLNLETGNRSIRHGAIGFVDKLSQSEIDEFELVDLNIPEQSYSFTSQDLAEFIAKEAVASGVEVDANSLKILEGMYKTVINNHSKKHEAFYQRKDNPEMFSAFKEALDNIEPEQLVAAFSTYEKPVEVNSDYGDYTPYKGNLNDNEVWFVDEKLPSGKKSQLFFKTKEDAEKQARFMVKRDESYLKAEQARIEQEKIDKAEQEAFDLEYSDIGFENESPMQRGKRIKKLSSKININGEVDTLKKHIERLFDNGYRIEEASVLNDSAVSSAKERYQELKRSAPTGNENHPLTKELLELKEKLADLPENYSKTELRLVNEEGSFYDQKSLGKIAMQYAQHLEGKTDKQTQTGEGTTMAAIEILKDAIKTETNADALMDLLEAALVAVEEADEMAEHEALFDDASNRITELLEAQ